MTLEIIFPRFFPFPQPPKSGKFANYKNHRDNMQQSAGLFFGSVLAVLMTQKVARRKRTTKQNPRMPLPKVELHVHFDGALANDLLYKHLTTNCDIESLPNDVFLPWEPDEPLQVRSLLQSCKSLSEFNCLCQCKGERSLNAMLKCFEIFSPLVRGQVKLLEENAYSFVRNQSRQNVLYTEVRYSPHFLATIDASTPTKVKLGEARVVVEAITRGLQRGCKEVRQGRGQGPSRQCS
jgi:adenosine deaminase